MATISFQVVETGQTTLTKTLNPSDATVDLLVQAYQADANVAVNGTATRAQVFNYIVMNVWVQDAKNKIQQFQTQPAVVPPQVVIA